MLSIIIPSYKGAKSLNEELPEFMAHLKSDGIAFEIIIVDDGSEDGGETEKVAKKYNCIFLCNEKNAGKGEAVRKGMLYSKQDYRIFTDADIPFNHDAIKNFLYYLKEYEFDIVVGDRTLEESIYFEDVSALRKFASKIFTFIVGRFITTGNFDTQCGLKGFRGHIADDVFSVSQLKGFTLDVELIYIALKRNYNIKKLPVILRKNESSSVNVIKHSLTMLVDLFRIKYFYVKKYYKKHE